jgi:hypothetical protein
MNSSATPQSKRRVDPVLAAIVFVTAVIGALAVSKARNWAAMTDELLYTGMARSIGQSFLPLPQIRGVGIHVNQVLFPTVIAPLVGSLPMTTAYPLIAALNACIFASAAIPAYLLTSLVTENRTAARWVAVCTVITPWLSIASKSFPDPLAYVAVLWTAYALVRTAGRHDRPLKGDLLTLLAIVLAYLVRNQFLLLVGVWVGVVVLCRVGETLADKSWRDLPRELITLLKDRPLPFLVFIAVVLSVKLQPSWLLGVYTVTSTGASGGAVPSGLIHAFFNHASVVALGIAGLPVILGLPWLVVALGRVKDRVQFDTAVVIIVLSVAILYVGASFDQRFTEFDRVIERYVFYIAPLFLVAMAAFFTKPPKTIIGFALPALAGLLLLRVSQPYGSNSQLAFNLFHPFSPAQLGFDVYQKVANVIGISIFGLFLIVSVIVASVVWWLIESDRRSIALNGTFALLLIILCSTTIYTLPKVVKTQNDLAYEVFGNRTAAEKHWLDSATNDQPASVIYSKRLDVTSRAKFKPIESINHWWDLAFWNGSVNTTYGPKLAGGQALTPYPGTSRPIRFNWETGAIKRWGDDESHYMLQAGSNPRFAPQHTGEPVIYKGFVLYNTGTDATAAWATEDLTLNGWVPPAGATLRVYAPRDATKPQTVGINLQMASTSRPPDLAGFKIEGASDVKQTRKGPKTTYSWTAKISPNDHLDFKLVRGEGNAHVEQIVVTDPLQG